MRILTTIVVFLLSLAVCSTLFLILGVPFRRLGSVAGALVFTWIARQWVFAKVVEWHRRATIQHVTDIADKKDG